MTQNSPAATNLLLLAAAGVVQEMETAAARASLPVDPSGAIDYSGDFFGEKTFLTVSGQLNGGPHYAHHACLCRVPCHVSDRTMLMAYQVMICDC
jgi:hypothetical protein